MIASSRANQMLSTVLKQLKEHGVRPAEQGQVPMFRGCCGVFGSQGGCTRCAYLDEEAEGNSVGTKATKCAGISFFPWTNTLSWQISAQPGNHAPSSQCAPLQWPTMEMVARMHSGIPGS